MLQIPHAGQYEDTAELPLTDYKGLSQEMEILVCLVFANS